VLITLVIIGVVAALTIPNLMQKYTEQATVKKVQKFYSNLSNAYTLAMKENGTIDGWGITGNNVESASLLYKILFKPYFKIAKNCGTNNKGNCLANVIYKKLNNEDSWNFSHATYYQVVLDNGAVIFFRGHSSNDTAYVVYDVNGHKEPNQWGRDTFSFWLRKDRAIPSGLKAGGELTALPFISNCQKTNDGGGCAAWVIYKGNLDYLHCDGLTWKSKSCKDK